MKALLLVSELEDYAIAFANGLAAHARPVLAVPRRNYESLSRWVDPGVDLRLLDWPRHRSPANLPFLLSLARLVQRERPDVIHLLSNNVLWLNLALPLWRRRPILTTVHDVEVHPGDAETQALPGWATTLSVRQSDAVVVHGEGLRRAAAARFGRPLDEVQVLSHPAIDRYARLAQAKGLARRPEPGTFRLLMFGRIYAYKGLDLLLRAEARLGADLPGLRIVIAGRGNDPWEHKALMGDPERYDIRHRFIEDAEVAELFTEADAVVLPYAEASQSGVLNLAAAFGLPVIATDVGELRATVEGQRMGLAVPAGDAEALAGAIRRLATDPALRADMGARARAWAEGPNAPAAVGAEAVRIYERVLARHPVTAGRGLRPAAGA